MTLPHTPLGTFPTPLQPLPRLTAEPGGPELWVKRDDLTGLALGGNKVRKLEVILGDALARGCNVVVTAGAAQSNHCRQTAAAAARLGLPCHLLLGGEAPSQAQGNLLLDHLFGADIHWCGAHRKGEDIPALVADLEARGLHPAVVPYGGSNALGALGFLRAVEELVAQPGGRTFDRIVFASSSGGTHAGLLLGAHACGLDTRVTGIAIDKEDLAGRSLSAHIRALVADAAAAAGIDAPADPAVDLRTDWCAAGYGVLTTADRDAIDLVARREGILLDPVYTGRAMAGLLALARSGALAGERVLFWHTGGAPALFAHATDLLATRR